MPKNEKSVLFKNAAADWIEMLRPQIKESSNVRYRNLLNTYILPYLGETAIADLTQNQIELCCNQLLLAGGKEENGLAPKTVRKKFK